MVPAAILRGAQKSAHLRMTSVSAAQSSRSIPCDDLAFTLMQIRRVEQIAAASPHQKFRTPGADRVVAPAPERGPARFIFRQLWKREDLAPHLPGGCDLVGVGT